MQIAMSGASGFIGKSLRNHFTAQGWETVALGREDFCKADLLCARLEGVDTVINLAGAPIIARWSAAYKKVLYKSRIETTRCLVQAMAMMGRRPSLFISTSAVGLYSSGRVHTEDDFIVDKGFLGNLAVHWETEARKAEALGIRTVIFRFGIVLGRDGGALKQMLGPFKLGLGGIIGDGKQGFSFVQIEDLIRAYGFVIKTPSIVGAYNLTAPEPTTNRGLTKALSRALGRPAFMRVPRFVLTLRFGEGAAVLCDGQQVLPKRLLQAGFVFKYETIDEAIKACLH